MTVKRRPRIVYPSWAACIEDGRVWACLSCLGRKGLTPVYKDEKWALRHSATRDHELINIEELAAMEALEAAAALGVELLAQGVIIPAD